jgi:hypothetical protein
MCLDGLEPRCRQGLFDLRRLIIHLHDVEGHARR